MGYYLLPKGLRTIKVYGPVYAPTAEGHLTRLAIKALSDTFDNVFCSQIPLTRSLPPVIEDKFTRLIDSLYHEEIKGDVNIFIGPSKAFFQLCEPGAVNIALSLEAEPTKELHILTSAEIKRINGIGPSSWIDWWLDEYIKLAEEVGQAVKESTISKIGPINLDLKKSRYISLLLDSEVNRPSEEEIAKITLEGFNAKKVNRAILYCPDYNIQAIVENLQKVIPSDKREVDVITEWISLEERMALIRNGELSWDTSMAESYYEEVKKGKRKIEPNKAMADVGEAVKDWMIISPNRAMEAPKEVKEAGETKFKRIGFICDYTASELRGETSDMMLTLMNYRPEKSYLESIEWFNRKAEIPCCMDTFVIFQPKIIDQQRVEEIKRQQSKKVLVLTEMPAEAGPGIKDLIYEMDLVVFRSPLQKEAYLSAGYDEKKIKKSVINPICVVELKCKDMPKELPKLVGVIDVPLDKAAEIARIEDEKLTLVSNYLPERLLPGMGYVPWRDSLLETTMMDWVLSCEEYVDLASNQKAFWSPLATALISGKKVKSSFYHGCLSFQSLAEITTKKTVKALWETIQSL